MGLGIWFSTSHPAIAEKSFLFEQIGKIRTKIVCSLLCYILRNFGWMVVSRQVFLPVALAQVYKL